ncbi:DUF1775 domain-containing protein [Mesorhizobium sp.]|uniref:DUF1775 domain-containing protein n=1 Tax=Mesorhizobium sp. TaxID=1871066 RepID=UPI00338E94F9
MVRSAKAATCWSGYSETRQSLLLATALALVTGAASAHVSFETASAAVGSPYKAVLRVPHGCDGQPTDTVRIKIPEGVIAVRPDAQDGLEARKGRRSICGRI